MDGATPKGLSVLEETTVGQAVELFFDLEPDQIERVLLEVHERLRAARRTVPNDDQVMFSRTPASPLGKLTCVAKTKVDEPTFDRFLRYCAANRTDVAPVLRDWIYYSIYEKTCQQMVAERSMGGGSGPKGSA